MRLLLLLLIVTVFINVTVALRTFIRGRSKGGNLGLPLLHKEHQWLPKEQWFTQMLNHFDPTNIRVWKQRYFENAAYYKPGGPMFLLIGGEGEASAKWMVEGQWIEYAKQFGAMCFQLEHRFYGQSHPTKDMSIKNLVYLNSEQALADIAYFIENKSNVSQESDNVKWIVFGGSYSGSLAAWMRVKYPHLVHGAVSSSSPLLAQIDFQEYYVNVEDALRKYSKACVDAIVAANGEFHIMLRHRIGQEALTKKFKLCDPIDPGHTKRLDIANLYETLASNFAGIVQYNKDNRNNSNMANLTIDTTCNILTNETMGPPIDRLAYISNLIINASKEKCLDFRYDNMIHELRNITWNSESAEGGRQWIYQTCTEFGFFQTSTARPTLFSDMFPVEFFIQQCVDIFGPKYNMDLLSNDVKRTNTIYGALKLEVSNVVFVHGSIDPWHALGITIPLNSKATVIYINDTAHCADMYPPSEHDPSQLKLTRIQVGQVIDAWLKE